MAPDRTPYAVLTAVRVLQVRPTAAALARLVLSGRSLAVGLALCALAGAAYAGARTTAVFAVERIEVRGLAPGDAALARQALAPLHGRSLVGLRRRDLERRLAPLPGVLTFAYDRAFPHTLVVRVVPELPLAVLRRGHESWLVSRRGRVLSRLPRGARPDLPRVWVPRHVTVAAGTTLADDAGGSAVRALAALAAADVGTVARTVRMDGELTYVLRSGIELRLGSARAKGLKLAVAAAVLPRLGPGARYLDVSVPSRPVAGVNPQPETGG